MGPGAGINNINSLSPCSSMPATTTLTLTLLSAYGPRAGINNINSLFSGPEAGGVYNGGICLLGCMRGVQRWYMPPWVCTGCTTVVSSLGVYGVYYGGYSLPGWVREG